MKNTVIEALSRVLTGRMKGAIYAVSLLSIQIFLPLAVASAAGQSNPFDDLSLSVSARGACARIFRVVGAVSTPDGAVQISLKQRRSIRDPRVCELLVASKEINGSGITVDAPGARGAVARLSGPGPHSVWLRFPRRLISGNRGFSIRVVSAPFDQYIEDRPLVASLVPVSGGQKECISALSILREEEIKQRSCLTDADCGRASLPFGCGCQFAKPIRLGGDGTYFSELLEAAQERGCEVENLTTCNCLDIEGVVCRGGVCDWRLSSSEEATEEAR